MASNKIVAAAAALLAVAPGALVRADGESTTTTTLFLPSLGPFDVVASVIGADATAATYEIGCSKDKGSGTSECPLPGSMTLTEGPSKAEYTMVESRSLDAQVKKMIYMATCDVDKPEDSATCDGQISYVMAGTASGGKANPYSLTLDAISSLYVPVTITAGADKLHNTAATTAATATPSETATGVPTTASTTGTSTAPGSSQTSASDSESSTTGTSSFKSSATGTSSFQSTASGTSTGESSASSTAATTSSGTNAAAMPHATKGAMAAGAMAAFGGVMMMI